MIVGELSLASVDLVSALVDHAVPDGRRLDSSAPTHRTMQHLVTDQPAIGTLDHPQDIYPAHGADLTDTRPDINETEMIRWVPLDEAVRMIDRREIVGAATVVGVYRSLLKDRGSVAGRTPASADLRSPNGSTPPTPVKG
ncbi:hypothetical protein ACWCPQ_17355 [Nocardia sp. NPDC001965]